VREAVEFAERERRRSGVSERVAHRITLLSGSMVFVGLHIVWFTFWIVLNTAILSEPFDEFPFGFLTIIVSLEAIFLALFVLIAQNQQSRQADRQAMVDFQVNLVAEREVTKVLTAVTAIQEHLGIEMPADEELEEMQERTEVRDLEGETDKLNGERDQEA
jgi:uncharacterized membrane protein